VLVSLVIDIDTSFYFSSITYPLSSALESLDEDTLSKLTITNINNNLINNQTVSQDLESSSSDPLAIGETTFFLDTLATTQR
jgi:hypothetical protein